MSDLTAQNIEILSKLFPQLSTLMRSYLGNIHTALSHMVPENGDMDPARQQDAAILYQSYYRLLRLVGNLDTAPLLLDPRDARLSNHDLAGLLHELCQQTHFLAREVGIRLHCQLDKERYVAAVDPELIRRLVLNLLSNAMKATPAGGEITLSLRVTASLLLLSVSDSGCGIPAEKQATLFDFAGAEKPVDLFDPTAGMGLGLPICRYIALAHGGSIALSSAPGKGTTVTVSLPNRRKEGDAAEDVPFDYTGGFHPLLMELSDALPSRAFTAQYLD